MNEDKKLPVVLENLELPEDNNKRIEIKRRSSSGYVSILFMLSSLITLGSVMALLFLGNR